MNPMRAIRPSVWVTTLALVLAPAAAFAQGARRAPNIVVILIDDLGYGDVGCYGASKVRTPNVDRLAREGLRFTDAHSSSATCTPSRYSLLTGEYAWRKKGTGILPGDAALIIDTTRPTLPALLRGAGYVTGGVGKWHLGMGDGNVDWNKPIKPGPREVGFDYSFVMPATGDRVPCVFVEGGKVVNADSSDPIEVDYKKKVGNEPTGKENPEQLKMKLSHGHADTIVNGISRIGFMSGGQKARWKDDQIADVLTRQAVSFIDRNKDRPFFLYFATHDVHVPRVPGPRFAGKSACGVRGDVIEEMDWSVGEVIAALDKAGVADNTLLIFTSDNGPVVDDGYADGAERDLNGHKPGGPLRGTKYQIYEGGTRIPFVARWPGRIKPGTSDALVCQVDFLASLTKLAGAERPGGAGPDSENVLPAILGESKTGRESLVEQGGGVMTALRKGNWKFIPRPNGKPELYDLSSDLAETKNLAGERPEVVKEMRAELQKARGANP
jgi:arylsulfatase A-like enzyme